MRDYTENVRSMFKANFPAEDRNAFYFALINGKLFNYNGKSTWGKKGCLMNALVSYVEHYCHYTTKKADTEINNLIKEGFIEIKETTL